MANLKTEFELEMGAGDLNAHHSIIVRIIGQTPKEKPYVNVYAKGPYGSPQITGWIADEDTERFAVNILKALKSKHLK